MLIPNWLCESQLNLQRYTHFSTMLMKDLKTEKVNLGWWGTISHLWMINILSLGVNKLLNIVVPIPITSLAFKVSRTGMLHLIQSNKSGLNKVSGQFMHQDHRQEECYPECEKFICGRGSRVQQQMRVKIDFDRSKDLTNVAVMNRNPNHYTRHQEGSQVKIVGWL